MPSEDTHPGRGRALQDRAVLEEQDEEVHTLAVKLASVRRRPEDAVVVVVVVVERLDREERPAPLEEGLLAHQLP